MYKVLIVDDEEIVRNGLCNLIEWEKFGFTICGNADSGETALKKIKEYEPNLVLLDITMSGISGLDILEKYHGSSLTADACRPLFLILSGYSDFNYAQKAINCGALGYLLKPVDEDILEDKLREIGKILSQQNKSAIIQKSISNAEYLKQFEQMLLSETVDEAFEKQTENTTTYQLLLISPICCGFSGKILQLQNELLTFFPYANIIFYIHNSTLITVLRNTPEKTVLRYTKRFCEKYSTKAGGSVAALGPSGIGLRKALYSYQVARKVFSYLFFSEDKLFLMEEDCPVSAAGFIKPNPLLPHVPEFLDFIETYDILKEEKFLMNQKKVFCTGEYSPQTTKKMFMAFILDIQTRLHTKYPEKQLTTESVLDLVNIIYEQNYFSGILSIVKKFVIRLTESFNGDSSDATVARLIQYIQHNYRSDLKLENLGKTFNRNSAYLGKKFKKITGVSFNTYIDTIRIEAAKKMLSSTDLKVYHISEIVGYTNPDYFYLKFRKYVKITPNQFRVKNRKHNV